LGKSNYQPQQVVREYYSSLHTYHVHFHYSS
jgi:hypothetical protein